MYQRVIPRDLFNEAKLLKCLGQLSLLIHDGTSKVTSLSVVHDGEEFRIDQHESCGGLYVCSGLSFRIKSLVLELYTSYNSKENYPLLCGTEDGEIVVFTEYGTLTNEFWAYMDKLMAIGPAREVQD